VFVDERDVAAPREAVFAAIARSTGPARPRRWTLTETPGGGTHVRFAWRVHADCRLLRILTPVLRPALRWNHAWAIARAVEGLEPYARARSAAT